MLLVDGPPLKSCWSLGSFTHIVIEPYMHDIVKMCRNVNETVIHVYLIRELVDSI